MKYECGKTRLIQILHDVTVFQCEKTVDRNLLQQLENAHKKGPSEVPKNIHEKYKNSMHQNKPI